jgi:uracil-DNA glycosylase
VSETLESLLREIGACRICLDHPTRPLPHEPRPVLVASDTAKILIAGQAPGTRVHASGVPFDDRSGDRLREWLGMTKEAFYDPARLAIVPMGFCFPGLDAHGGDRPPRSECAPAWQSRLLALMPQVELVLVIGLYAQAWHLGADRGPSVDATVRDWKRIFERPGLPKYLPLPHPSWRNTAWLKRNPWFESEVLPVLRAEVARLAG